MSTQGSKASIEIFEELEIGYEHAYLDNPLMKACMERCLGLIPPRSKVLDVGCGTGRPVSEMLSGAGHDLTAIDISPKMIQHSRSRIKGNFIQVDMLEYQPPEALAAVFINFSFLQMSSYAHFHGMMMKFAQALQPDGYLIVGTMPADSWVKDKSAYDETETYVVDHPTRFMDKMIPTFCLSAAGMVAFIESMGLKIMSNDLGTFQPNDPRCWPEDQQYVIAQRVGSMAIVRPKPEPKD